VVAHAAVLELLQPVRGAEAGVAEDDGGPASGAQNTCPGLAGPGETAGPGVYSEPQALRSGSRSSPAEEKPDGPSAPQPVAVTR